MGAKAKVTPPASRKKMSLMMANATQPDSDVYISDGFLEESSWELVAPPAAKKAAWWKHFNVFDRNDHPEMKHFSHCNIAGCKHITKIDNGTGGLISHLRSEHRPVYDSICGIGLANQMPSPFPPPVSARASSDGSVFISTYAQDSKVGYKPKAIQDIFPSKIPTKAIMEMYKAKATWFAIDQLVPFRVFDKPSFRAMFGPFHVSSASITKTGNMNAIREEVYKYGVMAKDAVGLEMENKTGVSWTSDHWTTTKNETITTTSCHYIEKWKLLNAMIDFKVHHGRTTGEEIYQDHVAVTNAYSHRPNFALMGITDTTGSMGTLGSHLRSNDQEHGYCTDHVLHRNAILAFKGTTD